MKYCKKVKKIYFKINFGTGIFKLVAVIGKDSYIMDKRYSGVSLGITYG